MGIDGNKDLIDRVKRLEKRMSSIEEEVIMSNFDLADHDRKISDLQKNKSGKYGNLA